MHLPQVNPSLHSFCGSQLLSWVPVAPGSFWLEVIALSGRQQYPGCCFLGWHNGELMLGLSFMYNTPLIHFCGTLLPGVADLIIVFLFFWRNLDYCWIVWLWMQIKWNISGMCLLNAHRYLLNGRWKNNASLTISLWSFLAFFRHAFCSPQY